MAGLFSQQIQECLSLMPSALGLLLCSWERQKDPANSQRPNAGCRAHGSDPPDTVPARLGFSTVLYNTVLEEQLS